MDEMGIKSIETDTGGESIPPSLAWQVLKEGHWQESLVKTKKGTILHDHISVQTVKRDEQSGELSVSKTYFRRTPTFHFPSELFLGVADSSDMEGDGPAGRMIPADIMDDLLSQVNEKERRAAEGETGEDADANVGGG